MITITIDTGNQAFDDTPGIEVARMLRELATKLEAGNVPETLKDINGNTCGIVTADFLE